ncbi:MAG: DUF2384 domain-containing protein [Legionellaceae bacterium]|nr:DUF2384 domain-containing protein [Legionellaceae bacterium]
MPSLNPAMKFDDNQAQSAFHAVLRIFKKWGCSVEEQMRLLALKKATFYHYQHPSTTIKFNPDLVERMSYILNIHAALRVLFSHPDSIYGWVRKPNHAPFYQGKSAMDIMLQGRVVDLWAVASRLNAERGGRA